MEHLPPASRRPRHVALRKLLGPLANRATAQPGSDYGARVESEKAFFGGDRSAYDLPPIFSYWSNKYVRPALERFGYSTPDAMYVSELASAYDASPVALRTFVSLGSGDCATEIAIAKQLVGRGRRSFRLECVELNADLLAAGRARAAEAGVAEVIVAVQQDFNTWQPAGDYDGVLANSSLHHVVNLEGLLDGVRAALRPTGTFVTSDMIGRNGHMRWPEALDIVHEYWRELPQPYRYNRLLRRHEELYENWDCSSEGFEGIRAQDILRLLIERFDFDVFVPFGNVIDVFVERCFGHNFDPSRAFDAAFVDRVHARDVEEIARGAIKPTHVVAAMCVGRPGRNGWPPGLSPRFCVRDPGRAPVPWRSRRSGDDSAAESSADAPDEAAAQCTDYSDLWCDPESPGWGVAIHQHRSGLLMANLLLHDADGRPVWYSIQPGGWEGERRYVGRVFAVSTPASDQALSFGSATLREAGTVTLAFDDASSGSLAYVIDGVSGTRRIRRMQY